MEAEHAGAAGDPAAREDTFCRYLAKQLIARYGFAEGAPQAAAEIAAQSDCMLTFHDGYTLAIIALIDRDAHPGKAFTLSGERVRAIAQECLKLGGRVGTARMPVTIQLIEVGGASPEQPQRLGAIRTSWLLSRLIISAWAIDTQRAAIWTTADYRGSARRRFIQNLLDGPRETVTAPEPVAIAPRSFPWLTTGMIVILIAIFASEIAFGVGDVARSSQPTVATLLAFGGLMRRLVLIGEWYRLFTAPLLHTGFEHILLNAVALALAGYTLEPLIGRAWFAAVFVIGAICGALCSLLLNSDALVSVGASGAIMALFACMLLLARHFPSGAARTLLQMRAVYVLVPSLLPLTSALKGLKIDYAAHFGGAIGGALAGAALLKLWQTTETRPQLRSAGLAIAVAGLALFAACGALAWRHYPIYELSAALAPSASFPTTADAQQRQSADLVARYPRDPRIELMHAVTLLRADDKAGAEKALRAGLAEEALWRRAITGGDIAERLHGLLALLLAEDGRAEEAKQVAQAACTPAAPANLRAALGKQKLCAD